MAPPQWVYQVENFDPPPIKELVCTICKAIFCEPAQCPCLHVFCRQCITKWLQTNTTCPICKKRVTNRSLQDVVPIVKNMIMKLTLRCHNFKYGCKEILTLEACETHIKSCMYEMLRCKNKPCKRKVMRKKLQEHETMDCEHRYIKCDTCKLKIISTVNPDKHNCMEELLLEMKKKRAVIKKRNQTIKEQEKEIKKLKQAEKDREDNYSDSSYSVDIFTSGTDISTDDSDIDYVLDWTTAGTSDTSLEMDGIFDDMGAH